MRKYQFNVRDERGGMLAEAAAAVAILFPLLLVVLFVALEASFAFNIGRSMTEGSSLAARTLATRYRTNPEIVTDQSQQQSIFQKIRIPTMISSNRQFTIPANGWKLSGTASTVTVVVTYLPGEGSPALAAFPHFDPLNLTQAFRISSTSTFRLQQ